MKQNEQITMEELSKLIKKKYKDFDITSQHLSQIIRDNNKTRKRTRHGLIACKKCSNVWNRDCNGAKNIHKITYNAINGKERPSYLCRNISGVLHDTSKSKFTRPETVKPLSI